MNINIEVNVLVTDDQDNVTESHTFESLEQAQLKIIELEKEQAQHKQEQADIKTGRRQALKEFVKCSTCITTKGGQHELPRVTARRQRSID
uniref:Uncharacterized protein n=1 Tax=uncultured organism MedDCM-OCT-S11-C235 TaxID=743657 RepID=D6PLC0_9ZZZZ|nr:hypothetical protein [uncultured organism MedDCM-OCT-S11-C235]